MELTFRELADTAPVLIWMGDATGACTYLSRSWFLFTGQDPATELGRWIEGVHPDDRGRLQTTFRQARDEARPYQVEYRVRHRSGDYHWMLDSAAPRFSSDGTLLGYIGSIVDNEQGKRAEIALERSERRARIAAEAAGLGIWEWDLRSDMFEFSPRAARIFGFPSESALGGAELEKVIYPEDVDEVRRLSARALDPDVREHAPYRYRIRRADDGETRWILAHGEALFSEREPVRALSYIGTFQDITEQVEAERDLRQGEARLRLALEAGGLAVWELDVEKDFVTPSRELNALFGFPPDSAPSADQFRARYAPGEIERLRTAGAEAMARGENQIVTELQIILPSGEVRWLFLQAQAAPPLDGGGPRALGVVMDITHRKQSEERLAVVARELQHRVKNSLAVVQTLANQSFRKERSREDALDAFSSRLGALAETTDVMTRSDWREADLSEIVATITRPYRDGALDPFTIEGGYVPVPSRPAIALGMALHELCTNAVKYGALSVSQGRVRISWEQGAEGLDLLWQEEDGPPVPAERGSGFGTKLLERGLIRPAEGRIELMFAPAGLACRIRVKASSLGVLSP